MTISFNADIYDYNKYYKNHYWVLCGKPVFDH